MKNRNFCENAKKNGGGGGQVGGGGGLEGSGWM